MYSLHYHVVFTTKYRKPVLRGAPAVERAAAPGAEPGAAVDQGEDIAPFAAGDWRQLRQQFWGRHPWARGYFVCSSGDVIDDVVAEYIRLQDGGGAEDDRFKVSE